MVIDLAVVFVLGCVAASAWYLLASREVEHHMKLRDREFERLGLVYRRGKR